MTPRAPHQLFHRELSWLEFNRRVLEEAEDAGTPLLERLRFFCIFHSNLDEFFMVRVASLRHKIEEGDNKPDPAGLTPDRQVSEILSRIQELRAHCEHLYAGELLPHLAQEGIRILEASAISAAQASYLNGYFEHEVFPVLTPIGIDEAGVFPRLAGLTVNLAVRLEPEKAGEASPKLAIVQVPSALPGLVRLPGTDGLDCCWLSDVIRTRLASLFGGYRIVESAAFRITRDSELELDDEGYEDYVHMLETELRRRQQALPVRVEYEQGMSPDLLERLQKGLSTSPATMMAVGGPLDPRPLLTLVDLSGFGNLRYRPQTPLLPPVFEQTRSIFEVIREADVLLHHPYDSFEPVLELVQQAAADPDVLAIKQTLYRTSGLGSPVVRALVQAAESGKQVTVLVELTARFDEERNISWARHLEEAGAHVLYGMSGLKVHAKITLVVRRESEGIRRYVHLGTGNYNERTARLYTDAGLLTAAEEFGADASGFFNTITGYSEPPVFNRLSMAPNGMRQSILMLIRREIDRAQAGQRAGITAKLNSLVDPGIIRELYQASGAGVAVRLNVRGICCLRPGVPGLSENIDVISIVDRYLEHSRVFVFQNGGTPEVYLSSADWMPRNLDRRIELMFPVIRDHCKDRIVADLEAQFADNQKARRLTSEGSYVRVEAGRADPFRVQEGLYRRLSEAYEKLRTSAPVRFVPLENKEQ